MMVLRFALKVQFALKAIFKIKQKLMKLLIVKVGSILVILVNGYQYVYYTVMIRPVNSITIAKK